MADKETSEFSALEKELYKTAPGGEQPTPTQPQAEQDEFAALEQEFAGLEEEFAPREKTKAELTDNQLAQLEEQYAQDPTGILGTFVQHAAKGATAGTLDELAGFTRAAVMPSSGKETPDEDIGYVDRAQRTQEAYDWLLDKSSEDHPIAAFTGDVIGSMVGVGKYVKGLKSAAVFGAVEGVTRSKADIIGSNRDLAKIGVDGLFGGVVGGGMYGLMDKVSQTETAKKAGAWAGRKFKDLAKKALPSPDRRQVELVAKTAEVLNSQADDIQRNVELLDRIGLADRKKLVEDFDIFGNSTRKAYTKFKAATIDIPKKVRQKLMIDGLNNPAVAPTMQSVKQYVKDMDPKSYAQIMKGKTGGVNQKQLGLVKRLRELKDDPFAPMHLLKIEMQAKGIATNADNVERYLMFRQFEDEMSRFALFASKRKIQPTDATKFDPTKLTDKSASGLRQGFKEAIAEGKINGDTYQAFRAHEAMMEVVAKENAKMMQRAKMTSADEFMPVEGSSMSKGFRYAADLRYVAAKMDNHLGTDLGPIMDDVYVAHNRHTAFVAKHMNSVMKLIKARRESGVSSTDLFNMRVNKDQNQLVGQMDRIFKEVRDEANKFGLNIAKKEDYVRHQMKPLYEVSTELRKWYKELQPDMMDQYFAGLATKRKTKEWRALFKDKAAGREYAQIHNAAEAITGEPIRTAKELKNVLMKLDDFTRSKTQAAYKAGMAMKRRGGIPERLRETDADRLLAAYINDISKAMHYTEPLRQIQSRAAAIRELGLAKEADYLDRYVLDMSGIPSGLSKKSQAARNSFRDFSKKFAKKHPLLKEFEAMPDVMDVMMQSIYPNMLGMNVKATLRNYTQPFVMTATDVGGTMNWYGMSVAGRGAAQTYKRLGSLGADLKARNLAPDKFVGEGSEGLEAALRDGWAGKGLRGVKTFNDWVMTMYAGSDVMNRHITMNMADIITRDLRTGFKNPVKLTRGERAAKKFFENMEPGYKTRIQQLIDKNGGITKEVQDEIAKYLVAKTQLVYGKVGMSQLQRDVGTVGSMFTKWPTTVTSELAYELTENRAKGAAKIMRKYLAPWMALYGAYQWAGDTDPDPRSTVFVSPNPNYYTPLNSIPMVITGDLVPPPLEAAFGITRAATSAEPGKRLPSAAKRATKTFVPVIGFGVNAYDVYYTKGVKNKQPGR